MNSNKARLTTIMLLILSFNAPLIISYVMTLMPNTPADQDQWAALQATFMGVYNLPLVVISGVFLLLADRRLKKDYNAKIFYNLSILTSIVSISLMVIWGIFKP